MLGMRSAAAIFCLLITSNVIASESKSYCGSDGGIVYTTKGAPYSIGWCMPHDQKPLRINFTITRYVDSTSDAPNSEWFAIGLAESKRMRGSDMYVIRMQPQTTDCLVSDRFARQYAEPELDIQLGGKDDVQQVQYVYTMGNRRSDGNGGAELQCSFTRFLTTGDPYDFPIENKPLTMFWASGQMGNNNTVMLQHRGTIGSIEVNLFEQGFTRPSRLRELRYWHGLIMLIAWFALMIPPVFLARYMKFLLPGWFKIHWRLQAIGVLLAVIGVVLAFIAMEYRLDVSGGKMHVLVGLILMIMLAVQVLLGYLSNATWFEGKPPAIYPDKLHWWMGRLLLVGGAVNCCLGILLYWELSGGGGGEQQPPITLSLFGTLVAVIILSLVAMEIGVGQVHEHESGGQEHRDPLLAQDNSGTRIVHDADDLNDVSTAAGNDDKSNIGTSLKVDWRWSTAFTQTFFWSVTAMIILLTGGVGMSLLLE